MTDQEIIIEVAKLDGWTQCHEYTEPNDYYTGVLVGIKVGEDSAALPDYLTSRDAIIPVIEKQSIEIKQQFSIELYLEVMALSEYAEDGERDVFAAHLFNFICVTPEQLSIALLKATGKWKE